MFWYLVFANSVSSDCCYHVINLKRFCISSPFPDWLNLIRQRWRVCYCHNNEWEMHQMGFLYLLGSFLFKQMLGRFYTECYYILFKILVMLFLLCLTTRLCGLSEKQLIWNHMIDLQTLSPKFTCLWKMCTASYTLKW